MNKAQKLRDKQAKRFDFSHKRSHLIKLRKFLPAAILITGLTGSGMTDQICTTEEIGGNAFLDGERTDSVFQEKKYRYVGLEKCAAVCHNNREMGFQYDIIRQSRLAEAFSVLDSRKGERIAGRARLKVNPKESEVCLRCHVTGGGLDTSFFAATYKKEDGITCEACHKGPNKPVSFLPAVSDCLKCHNNSVHRIPEFIFSERTGKIAHRRPEITASSFYP